MVGSGGSKNWSFFVDVINGLPLSENELSVPKPRDVKPSVKFPDLWKRMAFQSLIPKTGYPEILYDMYCPTIQKKHRQTNLQRL